MVLLCYCGLSAATTGIGVETVVFLAGANEFDLAHRCFAGMLGREMLKIMVVAGLAADLTQIPDDAVPYGNEFAEHFVSFR